MDWNLKITDMAGATPEHSSVIVNFVAAIRHQLKNSTCYVYSDNVQYRFKDNQGNNKIVIPDASINCRTKSRRGNTFTDAPPATFDVLFRSLLPNSKENILVNLHIDFEFQKEYDLGYPVIKRGIYYGCRKLSAQIDKIGKNEIAYKYLEKVYSIWICLEGIPKRLQNTISYYKIQNYKNEGFPKPDIKVNTTEADLIEIVIVRLGGENQDQKGLVDFLYGLFSGNQEKVLSYIPDSDKPVRQKEVADMLSMISYAEENGIKKGEKKGENRLGTLMNILLKNKLYSDAEKYSEDEEYREELYKEYKL